MHKILKIILAIFACFIIIAVSGLGLVILDVAGNFATDTHPLPNGAATQKVLIVYDPGLSGAAKDVATKIGYNFQDSGYDVVLAGVKSQTAANPSGYAFIVVGGPIYAGSPAGTIKSYLDNLNPPNGTEVGVFGFGGVAIDNTDRPAVMADVAGLSGDNTLTISAAAKITSGNDVDQQCHSFVIRLLQ
jgi:hypothetical protein